eukprot:CAMPEP_0203736074 /NCGR_PEP_ID=MMETSP0092-20131115/34673_1 /ASSEMBLY_ACC=CAM_ASM_001090 /TAXON_ID=426623 /ORGANISM="Chaetoceros affinis, Strain CCMP159" /LENGTH=40 /DNA_ID= /DNA_START= /DNA_END= /DNA_ORIENTATION=
MASVCSRLNKDDDDGDDVAAVVVDKDSDLRMVLNVVDMVW